MFKRALVLISTFLFVVPAIAAPLLDEPDITPVGDQAEIRINFTTPITYLRHFPQDIGQALRISVDVTDPCVVETIRNQEYKNYPANGLVNPFKITFPEVINTTSSGNATCEATKNRRINTTQTLLVRFENETPYTVRLGDDNHSIIVTVAIRPGAEVVVPPPKLKVPMPPKGATAEQLLSSAKAAITEGEYDSSIEMLNRLLNMPPNKYSQEAQEQVGMARELNRDLTKAKLEYELYLKLYPNSDGAKRVQERLAGIEAGQPVVSSNIKPKQKFKSINEKSVFGSVSQYYYGGRTLTDNRDNTPNTRTTDQSELVTNVDMIGRWRHDQYDDKVVIRDQQTHRFPPGNNFRDVNRLTSAYWDHEDKQLGFMTRLGRQPGNSQGILGRFDGLFGRYTLTDKFKITGVAGVPYEGPSGLIDTNRYFYGSALEFSVPSSNFSGNVYGIQQMADGIPERRAVGTELRYFKDNASWFGLLDYDTLYHEINIALIQGNWVGWKDINFNALIDHRKTPILYGETGIRTAAPSSNATSVGDLVNLFTRSQIYHNINTITADADSVLFGATKQVNLRWQLGGDVRLNRTSSTGAVIDNLGNVIPGMPATGISYTYSGQAIGTNTIFQDDTSIFNASYIDDPTFQGQTFGMTNLATFRTKYRVDTSINLFHSRTNSKVKTVKVSPSVRLAYLWSENATLEAQLGVEETNTDDQAANTKQRMIREFMFVGYRWDY
jgi:tetratricopeptide (TPR) repeat protein